MELRGACIDYRLDTCRHKMQVSRCLLRRLRYRQVFVGEIALSLRLEEMLGTIQKADGELASHADSDLVRNLTC